MIIENTFKSETIYNSVQDYISRKFKRRYNQKATILLTNIFSNVTIEEIDISFIVSRIEHESICDGKDLHILTDFICYLISNGVKFNKSRLFLEYIPYIGNSNVNNHKKTSIINTVLTNDKVVTYNRLKLINDLSTLVVYVDFIELQELINSNDKTVIDDYLDIYKLNNELSILHLKNIIRTIKDTIKELLREKQLDEITPYDIAFLLKQYNKNNENTRHLIRFCYHLVDITYYSDGRFDFLKNLNLIQSGLNINTLIEIFSNPMPWKYKVMSYVTNNNSKRIFNALTYIDCNNNELVEIILKFLEIKKTRTKGIVSLGKNFNLSLGNYNINSVLDFNYTAFLKQVNYVKETLDIYAMSFIVGFYNHIAQNINPDIFSSARINSSVLLRQPLSGELMNGFIITPFNPSDFPPEYDKILLHHYHNSRTNTSNNTSKLFAFDFTQIKCNTYRKWVKKYIWSTTGMSDKRSVLNQSSYFLNFIYSLKKGEILSIYSRKTTDIKITALEVQAFKVDCESKQLSDSTIYAYINNAKNLLQFTLCNDGEIAEASTIYHLETHSSNQPIDNIPSLSDDEVSRLSLEIGKNVAANPANYLYYAVFRLMIETELRLSHIIALKIGCVKEAHKKNEYVLCSYDKTSLGEENFIGITLNIKNLIYEIELFTKPQRKSCSNQHIKNHLFIKKGYKHNSTVIVTTGGFRDFLKMCCQNANIEIYNPENIRKTYMTNAQKYIIQKALTDIELLTLSGHKSKEITKNHYVDWSIKDMLEAVHGITIGNISVSGQISIEAPKNITSNENLVSNECGYCNSAECENLTFLECLMCNNFIATLDRIPFFNHQISIMDMKIKNAQISHDCESYYNIKRLLTAYLCELLILQEG